MIARSLLEESGAEDVRIFYSYARRDKDLREEVERNLATFDWDVVVRVWRDDEIPAGAEWEDEIAKNLAKADIILLFVTQAFIDSTYCREIELPEAMKRHDSGEARVVPIILENTVPPWRELELSKLQVLPRNGVAVSDWDDRKIALEMVGQGLVDLIVAHGLMPHSRWQWEILLEGDHDCFEVEDRRGVVESLREMTCDRSLRLARIEPGIILLKMESTEDALAKVAQAFDAGDLKELAKRAILRVTRLFGAEIHASAKTVSSDSKLFRKPPNPELMVLPSRKFTPVLFKGISFNLDDPLASLKSTFNSGDTGLEGEALEQETGKLMDYFLTCLAAPQGDIFVNLAPDENVTMLSKSLSGTRMGAGLLELDYRLKRLCASLLHPDLESGRAYWREVERRCRTELSGFDATVSAFQRVWLAPKQAVVYETTRTAVEHVMAGGKWDKAPKCDDGTKVGLVVDFYVEAQTELQRMAANSGSNNSDGSMLEICDEVFRELILPIVEKEVNAGEGFAEGRQLYNAQVLAVWFKQEFANHPKVSKFIDSGNPGQLGVHITSIESKSNKNHEPNIGLQSTSEETHDPIETQESGLTPHLEDIFQTAIEKRESGDVTESIAFLVRVVDEREESLGSTHNDTLVAMSQLGRSYVAAGDLDLACGLHEKVLEAQRKHLGSNHQFTCNSMEMLAATLLACGDDIRARQLQAEAGEQRIRASESYKIPENRHYFERYMDVFRDGVVYVERDEYDVTAKKKVRRAYFTGALDFRNVAAVLNVESIATSNLYRA